MKDFGVTILEPDLAPWRERSEPTAWVSSTSLTVSTRATSTEGLPPGAVPEVAPEVAPEAPPCGAGALALANGTSPTGLAGWC